MFHSGVSVEIDFSFLNGLNYRIKMDFLSLMSLFGHKTLTIRLWIQIITDRDVVTSYLLVEVKL